MIHLRSAISIPRAVVSRANVALLLEEGHIMFRLSSLKDQLHAAYIAHNIANMIPQRDARTPRFGVANVSTVGSEGSEAGPLRRRRLEVGEAVEDLMIVASSQNRIQSLQNCVQWSMQVNS